MPNSALPTAALLCGLALGSPAQDGSRTGPLLIEPFPELALEAAAGPLRAGAARADVTPDLSAHETVWEDLDGDAHFDRDEPFEDRNGNGSFDALWLAGFGIRRPATGVHTPLEVRALVLERGELRVGLAVIDAVGWFGDDIDAARAQIDAALGLDHVILASTHAHEGPDLLGLWGSVRPEYPERVQAAVVQAVTEAAGRLRPVALEVAQVATLGEDGSPLAFVGDGRDPVVLDPTLSVLRFADAEDAARTVATLVHWTGHPEYSGSRNNLITADYPHALREALQHGLPAEPARGLPAVAGLGGEVIFAGGALGGQIGPSGTAPTGTDGEPIRRGGVQKADALGRNLGRLALGAVRSAADLEPVREASLALRTGRMDLQVHNGRYHAAMLTGALERAYRLPDPERAPGPKNVPLIESRVTYLRVGSVAFITAPGELHPELFLGGYDGSRTYGLPLVDPSNPAPPDLASAPGPPYLRDLLLETDGVEHALVFGMAEDFLGYVVPAYNYRLADRFPYFTEAEGDHYEETNSLGPLVEAQIVGAMRALVAPAPPPAAAPPGDDWPQWRGPHRDGVWRETGLVEELPADGLEIRWRAPIGGGYAGPSVADGRVYVMDRLVEPEEVERVHCFAWDTGEPLWTHTYPCSYEEVSYEAGPRCTVLVEDGRAYTLGAAGHLFCLDAASGEVLWSHDLAAEYAIDMPIWGIAAAPVLEGGLLVVPTSGTGGSFLVAFDARTGEERWRALDDRGNYSAPIVIDQAGRRVLVCWTGDRVVGVDPATGALHWEYPLESSRMPLGVATPVLYEDKLFFTGFYDGSALLRLDPDELAVHELWRRRGQNERSTDALHSIISTPLVRDGHVYGVDSYGELRCLRLSDGERVWEDLTAVPRSRWATIHFVQNGERTWMFNERGELILAELSPAGFRELSRAFLIAPTRGQLERRGGVCWSHPAFAYRHVFARNDEELVCADLSAR